MVRYCFGLGFVVFQFNAKLEVSKLLFVQPRFEILERAPQKLTRHRQNPRALHSFRLSQLTIMVVHIDGNVIGKAIRVFGGAPGFSNKSANVRSQHRAGVV
jgi:hypothetical protein